jgi:hypothetical protein
MSQILPFIHTHSFYVIYVIKPENIMKNKSSFSPGFARGLTESELVVRLDLLSVLVPHNAGLRVTLHLHLQLHQLTLRHLKVGEGLEELWAGSVTLAVWMGRAREMSALNTWDLFSI